ncbi:MAG: TSUP family transporter [Fluviibacter sp.]
MSWWLLAYIVLGTFSGFIAGLFGVGGGLTIVPILLMMFAAQGFPASELMHLALGTSMATIMVTSLSSMGRSRMISTPELTMPRNIVQMMSMNTNCGNSPFWAKL